MRWKFICFFLLTCYKLFAGLDRAPEGRDLFKAHFKREMAAAELVFTYESVDTNKTEMTSGTAFIMELFGASYIVTNRHVLDSIIIDGHKEFALSNAFGRQLLITSPIYYQLKEQKLNDTRPEVIKNATSSSIGNDLVLIPYSMEYFVMEAFKPSRRQPQADETAITYGNTEGQGFINDKEGIINYVDTFCFGLISKATHGNSGGPVITLENELIGMLSAGGGPKGSEGAGQTVCINLTLDSLSDYYYKGQFEAINFPDNVVHYYTETLVAEYVPKPHHSRDKQTPHLGMGLAIGNLENVESVWDMKIRGNHKPLECYNWDVIPRDRLIRLCITYGQTVVEFIPKEWFRTYYDTTITAALKAFGDIESNYGRALRARKYMDSLETREDKLKCAIEHEILLALRDVFNSHHQRGKKMRQSGEIANIAECLQTLDAGL